jgi:hypothetical protein
MSDTPKTDAELKAIKSVIKDEYMLDMMADFARKLEREREEAIAALVYIAHSGLSARHLEDYAKEVLRKLR